MTRRHYRYVPMGIGLDPLRPGSLVRAVCDACGAQSPEPAGRQGLEEQNATAQEWCTSHAGRDYPDGRHLRYTSTVTTGWVVVPAEDIGPAAPSRP